MKLELSGRIAPGDLAKYTDMMETIKRPGWLGLLSPNVTNTADNGYAGRRRGKRNPWVVVGFFGLVVLAWINSQM